MIPIVAGLVAELAKNGLSLLSSAIQAKGKEAIEERLGVKLPSGDTPLSNDQIVRLKELEMAHEESLLALSIRQQEQDLESFKVEVEDRDSARKRDTEIIKSG